VFLTATLLLSIEERFFQQIRHPAHTVSIYHAQTSRGNVVYRVWQPVLLPQMPREPHQWLVIPGVVQYIQGWIQQARGSQVIIYRQTKSQVQAISQELEYKLYYSKVVDQARVIQQFQDRLYQVITATSILDIGINIPDIRCIIYVRRPRTLLEYRQESGRAGQDRLASEAIIIHPEE
jgi:superfamily II DNA helicase RecQ